MGWPSPERLKQMRDFPAHPIRAASWHRGTGSLMSGPIVGMFGARPTFYFRLNPGPRSTLPGSACVILPSAITGTPLTSTQAMPCASCFG